jgi:Flp pilus assembly protein TadD
MNSKSFRFLFVAALAAAFFPQLCAQNLKISLPKRSHATPVQELNQEGVKAVNKHDFKKAERLFYKAYLIDPDDPFTLNNLGYISELQGKVDRALRYYQLASRQNSDTTIANASVSELKGKPLTAVTTTFGDRDLRVNRGNIEAMSLLQRGRPTEAENLLRQTLAANPHNAFTLNNLGYTMETEGDLNAAYQFYTQAANQHSSDKTIVAPDPRWRGKPISEVAERNARAVNKRVESEQSTEAQVARLNLQGVSALNHNQPQKAREFFQQAYKLDPRNAFALNNMGYVAEMNGDQETAQELYREAKAAPGAGSRVSVATRREMVGAPLAEVANTNDQAAQANMEAVQEARRRQGGPIQLRRRDNSLVQEPETPPANQNQSPQDQTLRNQSPQTQPVTPSTEPPQDQAPQQPPQTQTPATASPQNAAPQGQPAQQPSPTTPPPQSQPPQR